MASAAAPNSGFRAHLKGITSSNDDPDQCALCHGCIRYRGSSVVGGVLACCGKRICSGCPKEVVRRSVKACSCCGGVKHPNTKSLMGRLKKQAKAGAVWTQGYLGVHLCLTDTTFVDGLQWLEKSAEGGHAGVCYLLGRAFLEGQSGISLNYGRAREYLERAMALDYTLAITCCNSLVELAGLHEKEGGIEAFNSILIPLANSGFSFAQTRFAVRVFQYDDDPLAAYPLFKSALLVAETPHDIAESAYWFMACSADPDLDRFAIAKLLLPMANKSLSMIQNVENKKMRLGVLVAMKKKFCSFRKECATCGTALDRSNRKLCKGCRNHCYCSRECQKVHWNRKHGGHRAECKEAQELKVQIRDDGLMEKLTKK